MARKSGAVSPSSLMQIRAGIHCLAPAYAREMLETGFDLVTMGTDIRLFTAAYADAMAELRA